MKKSDCAVVLVKMKKGALPVCEWQATSCPVELTPGSWHEAKNMIDKTEKAVRSYEGYKLDCTILMLVELFPLKFMDANFPDPLGVCLHALAPCLVVKVAESDQLGCPRI